MKVHTAVAIPRDRPILAYGVLGLESNPCWGVVKWDEQRKIFVLTPSEASEYSPEECVLQFWCELPELPK